MNITEFLEARIAEDEERAGSGWSKLGNTRWETDNYGRNIMTPAAILAECAAKRAIIEIAVDQIRLGKEAGTWLNWESMATQNLSALAAVYASHPDYQQEWAL